MRFSQRWALAGTGEVYRARDTRLDRTAAVKILPEGFALDADRLERFEHETRILKHGQPPQPSRYSRPGGAGRRALSGLRIAGRANTAREDEQRPVTSAASDRVCAGIGEGAGSGA